jgi:HlyD family secretion protein
MNNKTFLQKIGSGIKNHKGWTTIVVIVFIGVGYYFYHSAQNANAEPQYVISAARFGTLQQTFTGTGQVSASNQTDILGQVSGTIKSINVNVGQRVSSGQLIATIDSTNAAISLQNAKLSLAKLTEPAKATDTSNATNAVNQSYSSAFDSVSTAYLDLPAIMAGMKDMLYGQSGFLSDQKSSFLNSTARTYRVGAGVAYDAAVNQYNSSLTKFKSLSRASSQSDLDQMFADTYTTMKDVADAVTKAQNTITYITTTQPDYNPASASTAAASVNGWASQANGDLASIVSAQNNISSSKNAMTTLETGANHLDIQSAQLTVDQAQQTYDNYFVKAPYSGIIGRIPVNVYGQAGASTVIATIVGEQKIASISLNEVDAAKVKVGQPVAITFNAIDGLNATGTVEEIDQIGTVTQGVVSYGVKILINTQDSRINPGMSVNTTIVTNQENNVLLVPNSAIKTQGSLNYVQVFSPAVLAALRAASGTASASTTRQFGRLASTTGQGQFASSTGGQNPNGGYGGTFASTTGANFGSTTRNFSSSSRTFGGSAAQTRATTISSATPPQQVIVKIGDSDDTNTVILSGLTPGQIVVTRTITSGSAQTTSAPSILSSLSGNRGGGAGGGATGGAARPTTGGAGAARPGN